MWEGKSLWVFVWAERYEVFEECSIMSKVEILVESRRGKWQIRVWRRYCSSKEFLVTKAMEFWRAGMNEFLI